MSPNADTRYPTAGLDLTEPVVLSVPPSGGRYHLLPILSGWTDVFASPGSRTTGDGPGLFAITGPSWSGELPDGVQVIRSPTAMERFAAIGLTRADRSTLDRSLLRRSMTACGTACSG